VIVNLRAERLAVNYPFVVQSHGGNPARMIGGNIMKPANDAGFQRFTISHWCNQRILRDFWTHYPHVKHRKCRDLSGISEAVVRKLQVILQTANAGDAGVRFLSRRLRAARSE